MSLYDKASLIQIPSLYKDGLLVSTVPEDRSGDFTFSRGSNLSATRVKEDGYIEKGYENLFFHSNQFNTTWNAINASITSGQSGYDGSNDAWLLTATGTDGRVSQTTSQGVVQTVSVYAKANTNNWIGIIALTSPLVRANFDLNPSTTGSRIGVTGNDIDTSIEDIGNGWFRCSVSYKSTITGINIYSFFDDNASNGTGSIYIQDAQLNQGLVALPYVESGATNGKGGVLENTPRIDFTGDTPSLLLEPSRTNVIPFSEYFDGFWNSPNLTELYNNAVSPEGLQNAVKVYPTTTGSFRGLSKNFGVSLASVPYTFSVFAKAGELEQLFFYNVGAPAGNGGVWFNLSSGIVGTTTVSWSNAQMEDYGNGWYRCSAVITPAASGQNIYALLSDANNLVSVTSNGTDGLYLYGTQLEQGYKTSYIPTYGVSQTRAEDVCTDAGDVNTFNSTEGVLFFEGSILDLSGNNKAINISASNLNVHSLNLKWRAGLEQMQVIGVANSGVNVFSTFSISSEIQLSNSKYAMVWNSTELKVYINGILKTTSSISTPFVTNSFTECNMLSGAEILYGNVNQLLVFPTALSDSECIALTTI